MNYLPFVSYGFYGATNDAEMYTYFCSYGLLGSAPAPSATAYYRIPTIPIHPTWPTIGSLGLMSLLTYLAFNLV